MKTDKEYLPSLDGLRAIAILLVVIGHFGLGRILPGGFGLTLFFFISGFLITRLLIAEYDASHHINLKNFYIRRFLRLYPALLLMCFIASLFVVTIGCQFDPIELLSSLFYFRNYYMVYFRHEAAVACTRIFDIVWSLAVEEHFYIVFPLLFIALYRQLNVLIGLLVASVILCLSWRLYLVHTQGISDFLVYKIYHLTETRADSIIYGCLVSLLLASRLKGAFLRLTSSRLTLLMVVCALLFTFIYRDQTFRETYRYSIQGIALSCLIPALLFHQTYAFALRWLSVSWLVLIGRMSYSLYLFHWIGQSIAEYYISPTTKSLAWLATAVPIALLLSYISFYYVERPIMQLRKRFGSNVVTTVVNDDSSHLSTSIPPANVSTP